MRRLIIIPAYNEQNNILSVIRNIQSFCQGYDFLVVNDCSKDRTVQVLVENSIPFLDLKANLGIGGAVQAGYKYALENGYDVAIQIDGDGQHDVSFLDELVAPIEEGISDISIGSRYINKEGFQSSVLRRAGIMFLSILIKIVTGNRIYDVTSGFRAINRKMIECFVNDYPQDYPEPESLVTAYKHGATIQEIPVIMRERQGGISSINARRSAYYMTKVSLAILLASMRKRKMI